MEAAERTISQLSTSIPLGSGTAAWPEAVSRRGLPINDTGLNIQPSIQLFPSSRGASDNEDIRPWNSFLPILVNFCETILPFTK